MESDMSDRHAFSYNHDTAFLQRVDNADSQRGKVYLAIEDITLTEDILNAPWNYHFGNDGSKVVSVFKEYSLHEGLNDKQNAAYPLSDRHSLNAILPYRVCSKFVTFYKPKDIGGKIWEIAKNDCVRKQIAYLSQTWLGVDFCEYDAYLGNYIFVAYNPIYRHIHWKLEEDAKGVYGHILFRENVTTLCFEILGYDKNGNFLFKTSCTTDTCYFYASFDNINEPFAYLEINVYHNNVLLDYYPHMTFVRSINLNMHMYEKTVRVMDENGNKLKEIDKYRSVLHNTPKPIIPKSSFEIDEYAYRQLEANLDFVFLESGDDEQTKKQSRQKGIDVIRRILASAQWICYICDIYFGDKDFKEFILPIENLDTQINILSSKNCGQYDLENMNEEAQNRINELRCRVNEYNQKIGGKVAVKLLKGNPILHDRIIIADEQVWMLGSSLNHFGEKSTTLVRVPQNYCHKIISQVERWWQDSQNIMDRD